MQETKLSFLGTGFQITSGARTSNSELRYNQPIHVYGGQALPIPDPFKCTRGKVARGRNVSVIGTKRTSSEVGSISAFEPKGTFIANQATSRG